MNNVWKRFAEIISIVAGVSNVRWLGVRPLDILRGRGGGGGACKNFILSLELC